MAGGSSWDDGPVTYDYDTSRTLKAITKKIEDIGMMAEGNICLNDLLFFSKLKNLLKISDTEEGGNQQKAEKAKEGEECPTPLLVITTSEEKTIVNYGGKNRGKSKKIYVLITDNDYYDLMLYNM